MLRWSVAIGSFLVSLGAGAADEAPCANPVQVVEFEVTTPESTALALADENGLVLEVLEGQSALRVRLIPELPAEPLDPKEAPAKVTIKAVYTFGAPGKDPDKDTAPLIGEASLETAFRAPVPAALPDTYRVIPLRYVTLCDNSGNSVNDLLFGSNCCLTSGGLTVCGCEVAVGGRYCCGSRCCPELN
jgi:hypothetical protein